jgi:PhnB protein
MSVKPIPNGYHTVTPYLIVKDAASALDFYKEAFGATELVRMAGPGGKVMHAEIKVGDSPIMLADEFPEMGARSPQSYGGTPVSLALYVEDVDARVGRATAAGAKVLKPVADQFYGDRTGTLEDPFGHVWTISTHKEDVSPEEMQRRSEAFMKQQSLV